MAQRRSVVSFVSLPLHLGAVLLEGRRYLMFDGLYGFLRFFLLWRRSNMCELRFVDAKPISSFSVSDDIYCNRI